MLPIKLPSSYRPSLAMTASSTETSLATRPDTMPESVRSIRSSILVWYWCCGRGRGRRPGRVSDRRGAVSRSEEPHGYGDTDGEAAGRADGCQRRDMTSIVAVMRGPLSAHTHTHTAALENGNTEREMTCWHAYRFGVMWWLCQCTQHNRDVQCVKMP